MGDYGTKTFLSMDVRLLKLSSQCRNATAVSHVTCHTPGRINRNGTVVVYPFELGVIVLWFLVLFCENKGEDN